jgi:hypothetical protein
MGANVSTSVNDVMNTAITDMSTNIMNSKSMYTSNSISGDQLMNVDLEVGGDIKNCSFDFQQKLKIVNKVYSVITDTQTLAMAKQMQDTLTQTVANATEQKLSGVNLGQANITDTMNRIKNYNYTDLSTTIADTLTSNVNNAVRGSQNMDIKIKIKGNFDCAAGDAGKQLFSQNIDIDNIVSNTLASDKVQALVTDYTRTVTNSATNTTKQTAAGLDPAGMIMAAMFGLLLPFIIVIIVIALILKAGGSSPLAAFKGLPVGATGALKSMKRKYMMIYGGGGLVFLIIIICVVLLMVGVI